MNKKLFLNTIAIFLSSIIIANAQTAYIPNSASNSVSVIDINSGTVTATIPTQNYPSGVAVSPDGTKVYIGHSNSGKITVINTASNSIDTVLSGVGLKATAIALSPDGSKLYVTTVSADWICIYNISPFTNITCKVVGDFPHGIAVNPDGTRAYCTNQNTQTVSVLNTTNNSVIASIPVGYGPFHVVVNPSGSKVYVSNDGDSIINIIDAATNTVSGTINVGSSSLCLAISPDGTRLYVAKYTDNEIDVINTSNNTIITSIPVGAVPYGLSVTPDGSKLVVTNSSDNTVSIINTATNTVISNIPVGTTPQGIGNFISTYPVVSTAVSETSANYTKSNVYPNPTNGQITLIFPEENIEYTITNIMGEIITRSKTKQKTIQLHLHESGLYILHTMTSRGMINERIIVN